ncbi:MAG TPA: ankyrin repeat domain-containing protein [Rickettsia endosymbiont of Omalisus fontisbellaquei]|nr:ankyrin repeat domain-containing protein [Rickettsia endosymbiont of Omalisus fontisbellaquei]
MFATTFTKGGAIGYLVEDYNSYVSYARNIINIERILASSSPITVDVLFDAVNQHKSDSNPDNLKFLLEKAFAQKNIDPNIKYSTTRDTLLHTALHSYDIVEFLLEKRADPNILDNFGNTPLHDIITRPTITEQNRTIVTELLLQNGALTELKNAYNWTAIQLAVSGKNIKIVKLLVQYGANLNVIIPHSNDINSNKSLIELVSKKQPELKAFLKLATAYVNNNLSIVDDSVTTEDIKEFMKWKISTSPKYTSSNTKACFKYLHELQNFIRCLETKSEVIKQEIQKLNDYLKLTDLVLSKMVEKPDIYKYKADILPEILTEQLEESGIKLTGEINELSTE